MAVRRAGSALTLAFLLAVVLLPAGAAWAHPLGNFTTNSYAGLLVTPEEVRIDYVLDLAEVPAFQTIREFDLDGDGALEGREGEAFGDRRCDELAGGIELSADERDLRITVAGSTLALPSGEAGLPTLRLECTLTAPLPTPDDEVTVTFADRNADGRVGWREVTADGAGMRLTRSDVEATSISDRLRAYPEERLASPEDDRTARLTATPDGSAAPPPLVRGEDEREEAGLLARGLESVDRWFTGLVAVEDLTITFGLIAILAALGLGALHSLAPGHGKTVMAAYVVGREGSNRQALALAVTVAVTHTLGVLVLGVVLSATQAFAPEQLYPYLGLASGVLFAAIGLMLLRRALRSGAHEHEHDHGHGHGQEHDHGQGVDGRARGDGGGGRALTWRSLVAPGLAGGLVPSPSALLVLLGGIALGRAWFGVGLVVAYGIGMAATLVGAGYVLLRLRRGIEGRATAGGWSPVTGLTRRLPLVTSAIILVVGLGLATTSALQV